MANNAYGRVGYERLLETLGKLQSGTEVTGNLLRKLRLSNVKGWVIYRERAVWEGYLKRDWDWYGPGRDRFLIK